MYPNETKRTAETRKVLTTFLFISLFVCMMAGHAQGADTVNIIAKNPEVLAKSIYTIEFDISKEIPPQATIEITFPAEFDLSGVLIGSSTTINGGFKLDVNETRIVLKRSGLGRIIGANEKVDVKFANVTNPPESKTDFELKIEIKNDAGESIIQQTDKLSIIAPSEK
ncbi:MAG: hypothetical protein V2J62_09205 [candidate division KSB1 bacterium]|nr:hypothetical protein [candidate division KSB1 bacterium]